MSEDELAAIVIAVQTAMQQPEETPRAISAWKRTARLEALRAAQDDELCLTKS